MANNTELYHLLPPFMWIIKFDYIRKISFARVLQLNFQGNEFKATDTFICLKFGEWGFKNVS